MQGRGGGGGEGIPLRGLRIVLRQFILIHVVIFDPSTDSLHGQPKW